MNKQREQTIKMIVPNLRRHFGDKVASFDDNALAEEYENFSQSDMFGNNDARFLEWLGVNE